MATNWIRLEQGKFVIIRDALNFNKVKHYDKLAVVSLFGSNLHWFGENMQDNWLYNSIELANIADIAGSNNTCGALTLATKIIGIDFNSAKLLQLLYSMSSTLVIQFDKHIEQSDLKMCEQTFGQCSRPNNNLPDLYLVIINWDVQRVFTKGKYLLGMKNGNSYLANELMDHSMAKHFKTIKCFLLPSIDSYRYPANVDILVNRNLFNLEEITFCQSLSSTVENRFGKFVEHLHDQLAKLEKQLGDCVNITKLSSTSSAKVILLPSELSGSNNVEVKSNYSIVEQIMSEVKASRASNTTSLVTSNVQLTNLDQNSHQDHPAFNSVIQNPVISIAQDKSKMISAIVTYAPSKQITKNSATTSPGSSIKEAAGVKAGKFHLAFTEYIAINLVSYMKMKTEQQVNDKYYEDVINDLLLKRVTCSETNGDKLTYGQYRKLIMILLGLKTQWHADLCSKVFDSEEELVTELKISLQDIRVEDELGQLFTKLTNMIMNEAIMFYYSRYSKQLKMCDKMLAMVYEKHRATLFNILDSNRCKHRHLALVHAKLARHSVKCFRKILIDNSISHNNTKIYCDSFDNALTQLLFSLSSKS